MTLRAVESLASTATAETRDPPLDSDLALDKLRLGVRNDPSYTELLQYVKNGFPSDRYTLQKALRPYWEVHEDLYCDQDLILHEARMDARSAVRRRTLLARRLSRGRGYQAPGKAGGIDANIVNTVRACEPCQVMQPSQLKDPLLCVTRTPPDPSSRC